MSELIRRPFEIKITDVQEIRMGSPYNMCRIELVDFDKLIPPDAAWQDIYTWSDDSKKLVLVRWNFEDNIPGFHLYLIDTDKGKTKESPRVLGLPKIISVENEKIRFSKFLYNKEKSEAGKLCCNTDEQYEFLP